MDAMTHRLMMAAARRSANQIIITIDDDTQNIDLWSLVSAGEIYVPGQTEIILINNAVIGSSTLSGHAIVISDDFTLGDSIIIENYGHIVSRGADGGNGSSTGNGGSGQTVSGAAINAAFALMVFNHGIVAGGGGGGGGGGRGRVTTTPFPVTCGNTQGGRGGGGAGNTPGSRGSGSGSSGTASLESGISGTSGNTNAGNGGDGGDLGEDGQNGTGGTGSSQCPATSSGGNGGTAGFYAIGNSHISWQVTGTRLGRVTS